MKKVILCLILVSVFLTGCVKYEMGMEVKKDKSLDLSLIYMISSQLIEYSDSYSTNDEAKANLEKLGFIVNEYSEDDLTGIKATRSIKNIDYVSGKDDVSVNLTKMVEEGFDQKVFFKVKKGFLTNKYTAHFIFDLIANDSESTEEDETDYSSYANYLKFNYKLVLPNKSISNNATTVSSDGKTLTWNAKYNQVNDINFEFSLLNIGNIIISSAIVLISLLSVITITFVIKRNKNKKSKNNSTNEEIYPELEIEKIEETKDIEIIDIEF